MLRELTKIVKVWEKNSEIIWKACPLTMVRIFNFLMQFLPFSTGFVVIFFHGAFLNLCEI